MALWIHELRGVKERSAGVALVPARVYSAAFGASSVNIAVREEHIAFCAEKLLGRMLGDESVLVKLGENPLGYFGTFLVGCAPELVERDVEPLVYVLVDCIIVVAKLAGSLFLLQRLCLSCSSIFVNTADVHGLISARAAETREHVRRKHLNQVSKMGNIVHIGQRRCNQPFCFDIFHFSHNTTL